MYTDEMIQRKTRTMYHYIGDAIGYIEDAICVSDTYTIHTADQEELNNAKVLLYKVLRGFEEVHI